MKSWGSCGLPIHGAAGSIQVLENTTTARSEKRASAIQVGVLRVGGNDETFRRAPDGADRWVEHDQEARQREDDRSRHQRRLNTGEVGDRSPDCESRGPGDHLEPTVE